MVDETSQSIIPSSAAVIISRDHARPCAMRRIMSMRVTAYESDTAFEGWMF